MSSHDSGSRAVHGVVSGRVQGVYYRASFRREADRLGVRGWVRNLADGTVEFHVAGDADAIDRLLSWARRGPTAARVDELVTTETPEPEDFTAALEIRR